MWAFADRPFATDLGSVRDVGVCRQTWGQCGNWTSADKPGVSVGAEEPRVQRFTQNLPECQSLNLGLQGLARASGEHR